MTQNIGETGIPDPYEEGKAELDEKIETQIQAFKNLVRDGRFDDAKTCLQIDLKETVEEMEELEGDSNE